MERDSRRDLGEWRGCYNFDKIICDGDVPTTLERRGGLKMGQTYYYYYELNGSTETYNPSLPTTTTCPFLPGQTVNKLDVPLERRLRMKSASMNSLRNTDYQTMDPVDRFTAPRPPHAISNRKDKRTPSASPILTKQAARSASPVSGWTSTARRFLGLKSHRDGERGRKAAHNEVEEYSEEQANSDEPRSVTPSGSVRSRDLSPESLRRFLSDDPPSTANSDSATGTTPANDAAEETDIDDDDNFATMPADNGPFTNLSPPPFQRGPSSPGVQAETPKGLTATPAPKAGVSSIATQKSLIAPMKLEIPTSPSLLSMTSSSLASAISPNSNISQGLSQFSFFDDSGEDDEKARKAS
ncbi:hypothetical protein GGR50DRAFT_676321 [Xylaria sp. CBS 124048]|nr:hypothetical protein GGR50DRAFT_676321 [Xylaria sp. CBS 124048]